MKRIDHPTAVSGLFTEGNPGTGQVATTLTAEWANDVQEEICNLIEGAGLTLDGNSQVQLLAAVNALIDDALEDFDPGEGGGGGGTEGGLVKITASNLNSDATTTNTSATVALAAITHAKVANANTMFVHAVLDWNVLDAAGSQAKGYAKLQRSSNNSDWTDICVATKDFATTAGKALVKTDLATLASTSTTTSLSNVASGLAITYSPIAGANTRVITVELDHKATDSNGGGANTDAVLQYYSGSSWVDLVTMPQQIVVGGISSPNVTLRSINTMRYVHNQNDNAPQYRVVHKILNSGDTSEIAATTSRIVIEEFASIAVIQNRSEVHLFAKDTTSTATTYYRVTHHVESGDTSTVYANSTLTAKEYDI